MSEFCCGEKEDWDWGAKQIGWRRRQVSSVKIDEVHLPSTDSRDRRGDGRYQLKITGRFYIREAAEEFDCDFSL